jgi:hypothetical protein
LGDSGFWKVEFDHGLKLVQSRVVRGQLNHATEVAVADHDFHLNNDTKTTHKQQRPLGAETPNSARAPGDKTERRANTARTPRERRAKNEGEG